MRNKDLNERKRLLRLLTNSSNYREMIEKLKIEFVKFNDKYVVRLLNYTDKCLQLSVAMVITKKRDYFFAVIENKRYLKCYTTIGSVCKYLETKGIVSFNLRLNQGYDMNYVSFNIFGGQE